MSHRVNRISSPKAMLGTTEATQTVGTGAAVYLKATSKRCGLL